MNKFIRTVLTVVLVLSLGICSVVFFKSVGESILTITRSNYNISVIYSPDYVEKDSGLADNIVIGLDVDLGDDTQGSYLPSITTGYDNYYYLCGVKTSVPASISPEYVKIAKGKDTVTNKIHWFIDGKDTGVEVIEDEHLSYVPTLEVSEDNTYIIAGEITELEAVSENPNITVDPTTNRYLIDNVDSGVAQGKMSYVLKQGIGYGAPIHMSGDSLLSEDNDLLTKFSSITEVLESAQDYYVGKSSVNGDEHFANKYYLKNNNEQDVYLRIHLRVNDSVNNAIEACRFMLSYYDVTLDRYVYEVYALDNNLRDQDGNILEEKERAIVANTNPAKGEVKYLTDINELEYPYQDENRLTTDVDKAWRADSLVHDLTNDTYNAYSAVIENGELVAGKLMKLGAGATISYTFSAWFEASDPDHNDSIKDGSVSFSIDYEIVESK